MEADKRSLSGVNSASCGVAKELNLALFDVHRWNESNTSAPPQQTPSLVGMVKSGSRLRAGPGLQFAFNPPLFCPYHWVTFSIMSAQVKYSTSD
jgi:hypothetical protein